MKGCLKSSETKHRLEDESINFVLMSPIVIVFRNRVIINSKAELLTITTFRLQGLWVLFDRCYCLDSQNILAFHRHLSLF